MDLYIIIYIHFFFFFFTHLHPRDTRRIDISVYAIKHELFLFFFINFFCIRLRGFSSKDIIPSHKFRPFL